MNSNDWKNSHKISVIFNCNFFSYSRICIMSIATVLAMQLKLFYMMEGIMNTIFTYPLENQLMDISVSPI